MSLETIYTLYLAGAFLLVVLGVVVAVRLCRADGRANGREDDAEQAEYLSKYSDAKRAKKDVPVFLKKQAD